MGSEYENTYGDMISLTFNSPSYCAAFIILLAPFCIHYLLQAGKLLKTLVWIICKRDNSGHTYEVDSRILYSIA